MATIIPLIAYSSAAAALTVFGDIWLTEVLYRYRLRDRSTWGLAQGFSIPDLKSVNVRLQQIGRPGIIGQTSSGTVLAALQAPDLQVIDYTYLVRHYRGGATAGFSARRATTLVIVELPGRTSQIDVQPRARRIGRLKFRRRRAPSPALRLATSDGFDKLFRVSSGDDQEAAEFLTPAVREIMLGHPRAGFELGGRYLVADERRLLFGSDLLGLLDAVRRLRDALPVRAQQDEFDADSAAPPDWTRTGIGALVGQTGSWQRPKTNAGI